jgi:hypothetical protein
MRTELTEEEKRIFTASGEVESVLSGLSAVEQVKVIELVSAVLCQRMGKDWKILADAMHKHVVQLQISKS